MISLLLFQALALARPASLPDSAVVRDVAVAPGETLRTTSVGQGEPVVLIPGLFGAAYGYRAVTKALVNKGYRCIVVEPLGYGWSSHPKKADYSFTAQTRRVGDALDSLGVVRTLVRRVAVWVVPVALAYLAWWALSGGGLDDAWASPGEGGLSTWQGVDLVVGVTVSWVPLAADYTRFARTPRAAFWGTGIGYLVPDALLLALGAVVLLTRDVSDAAALPAAIASGGLLALLVLLALTIAETDEAFANAYSGAVSLQNLFPSVPQRWLVALTTTVGTIGALTLELSSFQSFLFLLGSCFVPLFAVLLADWLASGCRYDGHELLGAGPPRVGALVAWAAGFVAYQWLSPTGPSWWVDQVQRLDPPSWQIGATLPSFAVSFALALAFAGAARFVRPGTARA